jgi:pyridinium-3,5-biscarboxylic acid mononucleotide sulfurtransferase
MENKKIVELQKKLHSYKKVILAYSGGVDSTLLLKICAETLDSSNVIAVTGISQTYTKDEKESAIAIASNMLVEHILLNTDELANEDFVCNSPKRCYHCKKELYKKIKDIALEKNISAIIDATNADDLADYRPGRIAAAEQGITSPFADYKITKEEIRDLSRAYNLPTWNKPANPCLASRIPYGTRISNKILRRIESGERILIDAGFSTVRLRHHGDLARIEVPVNEIPKLFQLKTKKQIVESLKKTGYKWISVDLEGYRTGSLNENLDKT